ncbi:MAG: sugar phosphate isomerase/epimerase family protein [Candidatus Bathyarchaeia archaeon]
MGFRLGAIDDALGVSWDKVFDLAAQAGLEGVELGVGEDYFKTKLWKKEGRRELKGLSEASGVTIPSICLHTYWRFSFASNEEKTRARAQQVAEQAAEIASELGARNLLIPLTSAEGVNPEKARLRWVQGIKSCANMAESFGVIYALENVGQPFARSGEQLSSIIDEIGSSAVRAYYDPGNAVHANLDPVVEIGILGKRISQVHMKDPGGVHLGEGRMDIPDVLRALEGVGFTGWLIMETEPTDDPLAACRRNVEFLRKFM